MGPYSLYMWVYTVDNVDYIYVLHNFFAIIQFYTIQLIRYTCPSRKNNSWSHINKTNVSIVTKEMWNEYWMSETTYPENFWHSGDPDLYISL